MSHFLVARSKRAALAATFLIPFAGGALAQSADNRSTADIEKENAALRAQVHRLKAEKENAALRTEVDQLKGRRPVQQASATEPQPLVTRIQTSSPDRTLVMADMPLKAAPPPIAYYSWTGFYIGGNVGYSVGSDRSVGVLSGAGTLTSPGFVVAPAGAIGGAQIGYNWQASPHMAFGFEADFQGSDQKSTSCLLSCQTANAGGTVQTIQLTSTHSLDYFGTMRGRVGYVDGGALFYVTGGGAYGRVNQSLAATTTTTGPGAFFNGSTSENKFGFAVGAGLEASLGGNWTGKIEYLYLDLGNISSTASGLTSGVPPTPSTLSATSSVHDNIVRAGLNYRIGGPDARSSAYNAMAAVPPVSAVYNWTGFYIGVNAGYGFGNDRHQTDGFEQGSLIVGGPGSDLTPKGFLGGGQFGYNWQVGPRWLVGFEADLQGATIKDTTCISLVCYNPTGATNTVNYTQHIDWFSTVRGRLGAMVDNSLFYATGGVAFAHVKQAIDFNSSFSNPPIFESGTSADNMIGYAVGGGIETMLRGGWSLKGEYLFMNLGDLHLVHTVGTPPNTLTLTTDSNVHEHIVRAGLNYHFGAAPY